MKSKTAIGIVFIAALVTGYFLGRYQAERTWSQIGLHLIADTFHRCSSHEASRDVQILTFIREGHQIDGLNALEECLDGALIGAGFNGQGSSAQPNGKSAVPSFVQEAHDYCLKYPWTNSVPELDVKVRGILSLAK
jgi:hypothetical protein